MVNNPILAAIRTLCETGVSDSERFFLGVLVENTALVVLTPIGWVHWVITYELELAEAVVAVVAAGRAVDYECLAGGRVGELLRSFIRGQADVGEGRGSAVGCLLPGIRGRADYGSLRVV